MVDTYRLLQNIGCSEVDVGHLSDKQRGGSCRRPTVVRALHLLFLGYCDDYGKYLKKMEKEWKSCSGESWRSHARSGTVAKGAELCLDSDQQPEQNDI